MQFCYSIVWSNLVYYMPIPWWNWGVKECCNLLGLHCADVCWQLCMHACPAILDNDSYGVYGMLREGFCVDRGCALLLLKLYDVCGPWLELNEYVSRRTRLSATKYVHENLTIYLRHISWCRLQRCTVPMKGHGHLASSAKFSRPTSTKYWQGIYSTLIILLVMLLL